MRDTLTVTSGAGTKSPVRFDRERTELLRKKYDTAVRGNHKSLFFDGEEYITAYAGYLLEYLDTQLGRS